MNEYSFHCPVTGTGTLLTHCEQVHSKSTQGKAREIENKVCALAHLCWQCPARNAFKVGGIWSKPGSKPRSETPMETPAKLPRKLIADALSHTTPKLQDYRQAGMKDSEVGRYDELFKSLQATVVRQGDVISVKSTSTPRKQVKEKRPASMEDALEGQDRNDMADTVTELAKRDAKQRATVPSVSSSTDDAQKPVSAPQRAKNSPAERPARKLTLAERAKLMKERKTC